MKKILKLSAFTLVSICCFTNTVLAQTNQSSQERAKEGDTVWVIINKVKPEQRQQFERFITEIFWPAAEKLNQDEQRAFKHTRVLNATEPDEEGNYPYIFLMDPLISGANYDIEALLIKMYGEQKAKEHLKLFDDAVIEQKRHVVVQSKF